MVIQGFIVFNITQQLLQYLRSYDVKCIEIEFGLIIGKESKKIKTNKTKSFEN